MSQLPTSPSALLCVSSESPKDMASDLPPNRVLTEVFFKSGKTNALAPISSCLNAANSQICICRHVSLMSELGLTLSVPLPNVSSETPSAPPPPPAQLCGGHKVLDQVSVGRLLGKWSCPLSPTLGRLRTLPECLATFAVSLALTSRGHQT